MPMNIVVRGYAIPLGKIGLVLFVGVLIGGTHLSVHSLAAYKEGVKQGLRTEITRFQRTNQEREEAIGHISRAARQRFEWEGIVRLPAETITPYQVAGENNKHLYPQTGNKQSKEGWGKGAEENGWYRLLVDNVSKSLSPKGGNRK
jgi:hypothetical protein